MRRGILRINNPVVVAPAAAAPLRSMFAATAKLNLHRGLLLASSSRHGVQFWVGISSCARRGFSSGYDASDEVGGFEFTPDLVSEAKELSKGELMEKIMAEWLPEYANDEMRQRLRKHLVAFPINEMITSDEIQITHVENEAGEDVKFQLGTMTLQDALQQARDNERDLVQLASNGGKAFCRLRAERKRFMSTIQEDLDALEAAANGGKGSGSANKRKPKPPTHHIFKDVVDAHFIGWKSVKIFNEIKAGHAVKLSIQQFQNPEMAVAKMQEMLAAIKSKADAAAAAASSNPAEAHKAVPGLHFYTGIGVSGSELSITLQPVLDANSKVKQTRHPLPKDWAQTEQRLLAATGGKGTYRKSNVLVAKNVGAREFRTDKFGRRIE